MNTPRTALEELERIDARFVSGNSVPVERAHITYSEWSAIRKALSEALGGWLPIETAPHTEIFLAVGDDGHVRITGWHFHKDYQCFAYMGMGGWYKHNPTHWRPLPPPPTSAKGSEVET